MRTFAFITIGKIIERLKKENIYISRPTFMHLLTEVGLFEMHKTAGGWYTASANEVELIIKLIKENYKMINKPVKAPKKLV